MRNAAFILSGVAAWTVSGSQGSYCYIGELHAMCRVRVAFVICGVLAGNPWKYCCSSLYVIGGSKLGIFQNIPPL